MEEKNNIIDLCKMFWDIGNKTLASGIVKIKADDQEILEMLPKAFNWKIIFNPMTEPGESIIKSWDNGRKIWFCDVGLDSYKFTVQQLFQLAKDVDGLDYKKLKDSNYSMEFEFVDVGQNIEKVKSLKLIHSKGEPVEKPKIKLGKISPYVYNTENVINVMFDKNSYFAKTNASDKANLFLSELCSCLYTEAEEEVIETLRKNKETLKKIFNVKDPVEIYYQKDGEFTEEIGDLDLERILKEASE